MSSNNNNAPGFQIYKDQTATPSCRFPSNQNNQFALQPAQASNCLPPNVGTGQIVREAAGFLPPIPNLVLYGQENARQMHTAYNTTFVPAGNPVTVAIYPQGYNLGGNWHAGQLHNAVNERLARPVPDAVPFWTSQSLQQQDAAYRAGPLIPGTMWPTPAVGMTMHVPTLQVAQQNGMHINSVNPQGHIVWTWQGRQ
ncbi:hypothetical protein NW765_017736 [Fusarium oxysporum]|nr:hypothetical protein NW765_017736 [Fusarium oxysporum]KAJ4264704.1 hypothetical protein NW764_015789 [Fusarium oxysporum]